MQHRQPNTSVVVVVVPCRQVTMFIDLIFGPFYPSLAQPPAAACCCLLLPAKPTIKILRRDWLSREHRLATPHHHQPHCLGLSPAAGRGAVAQPKVFLCGFIFQLLTAVHSRDTAHPRILNRITYFVKKSFRKYYSSLTNNYLRHYKYLLPVRVSNIIKF